MQEISSNQGNHPGQTLPGRPHVIWLVIIAIVALASLLAVIMAIIALVSLLVVTLSAQGAATALTPIPSPTPTPASTTVEIPISQGSDDAGYNCLCNYSTAGNEIYFGECTTSTDITSGFRFPGVPIPQGAVIINAYIRFTVDGPYDVPLTLRLSGEASSDAQPFSAASRPDQRSPTVASVMWNIPANDHWELSETRHSPDLAPIVQEIVNRPDWKASHALAVIVENAAPAANQHRRVIGYERPLRPDSKYGTRLSITYSGAALPTATPTPFTCMFSYPQSSVTAGIHRLAALAQSSVTRARHTTNLADLLYRVRDEVLSQTAEERRYVDLFYTHSTEIAHLMLAHRQINALGLATLDLFVPGLESLLDGRGDSVTITAEQVKQAERFLDTLSTVDSPQLQPAIADERAWRPLEHLVGLTFDQAWTHLNGYPLTWLPPVSTTHPYRVQIGRAIAVQFTLTDFEGDFVMDNTVTLRVLDTAGDVIVGPVGLANNPTQGPVIRGKKYHYNLRTANLPPGNYRLVVDYNVLAPGQAAMWELELTTR